MPSLSKMKWKIEKRETKRTRSHSVWVPELPAQMRKYARAHVPLLARVEHSAVPATDAAAIKLRIYIFLVTISG